MAKRSRSTPTTNSGETPLIVTTTPSPQKRRRVAPDQANADGPHWYRGATPWHDLTTQERRDVEAAAENSVKFWEGPASS